MQSFCLYLSAYARCLRDLQLQHWIRLWCEYCTTNIILCFLPLLQYCWMISHIAMCCIVVLLLVLLIILRRFILCVPPFCSLLGFVLLYESLGTFDEIYTLISTRVPLYPSVREKPPSENPRLNTSNLRPRLALHRFCAQKPYYNDPCLLHSFVHDARIAISCSGIILMCLYCRLDRSHTGLTERSWFDD